MSIKAAYVTLLTKTSYLAGALVLDYGLRAVQSKYPLVVMFPESLPQDARQVLQRRRILTKEIQYLQPKNGFQTFHAHDARFVDTWTKLRVFELTEYDRIVFLDSDMLVMKNMDDLMDTELNKDEIAAAHVCACNPRRLQHYPADWIPENCAHSAVDHPLALPISATDHSPRPYEQLNSGTLVLRPSKELAQSLVQFLLTRGEREIASYSFADQDLLAAFFRRKWKPIHWYYNALRTLRYIHPKMWDDNEVRCVHYILPDKPWQSRSAPAGLEDELGVTTKWWWEQFDKMAENLMNTDKESWKLVESCVGSALEKSS